MKYEIHYTKDDYHDSLVIEGESIDEIRDKLKKAVRLCVKEEKRLASIGFYNEADVAGRLAGAVKKLLGEKKRERKRHDLR